MKRDLSGLAAAAVLSGMVATTALAAGGGVAGGGFGPAGGGLADSHIGAGLRTPFLNSIPATPPPPIFNPSSPYVLPQSPEIPVSPASPGSVFGNG